MAALYFGFRVELLHGEKQWHPTDMSEMKRNEHYLVSAAEAQGCTRGRVCSAKNLMHSRFHLTGKRSPTMQPKKLPANG
jgi:hypothetical protein